MAKHYTELVSCKISLEMKRKIDQFAKDYSIESDEVTRSAPIRGLLEAGLRHYYDPIDKKKLDRKQSTKEQDKSSYQLQNETDLAINEHILKQLYHVNGSEPISWGLLLSKGFKETRLTESITEKVKRGAFYRTQTTCWIYYYGYQYTDKEKVVVVKRD